MKHRELAARLDAAADRLTMRVLAEMYRDPFWHERFGERADRHGRRDGRFHIDYLIQALHAGDTAIIENYARWLQQVLTSRGMSTRHLAENFERLAAAIRDEAWPDGDAACAVLDAACAALRYPLGTPQELQRAIPALAAAAADALAGPRGLLDAAARARALAELTDLATYAVDAVALAQPAVFAGHTTWLAGFLERRGVPRARLVEQLAALAAAAVTVVPGSAAELRRVIDPAAEALAQGA
jgi:hypothetical protein